jgi:hypothetical protein
VSVLAASNGGSLTAVQVQSLMADLTFIQRQARALNTEVRWLKYALAAGRNFTVPICR